METSKARGVGVSMSAKDIAYKKEVVTYGLRNEMERIVRGIVQDWYDKHEKSFKKFDYDASMNKYKEHITEFVKDNHDRIKESGVDSTYIKGFISSVTKKTFDYFMKKLDSVAFSQKDILDKSEESDNHEDR